jgi:hypothetical protein
MNSLPTKLGAPGKIRTCAHGLGISWSLSIQCDSVAFWQFRAGAGSTPYLPIWANRKLSSVEFSGPDLVRPTGAGYRWYGKFVAAQAVGGFFR